MAPAEPSSSQRSPQRGDWKVNLALLVGSLVVMGLLLEGSSRFYDAVKARHERASLTEDAMRANAYAGLAFQPHPFLSRTLVPGQQSEWFHINAQGFRGTDFSSKKRPGVKRVLLTGGSVAFGAFLNADQDTPGAVLEKALGKNVEVYNLGVPSYASTQELFLAGTYALAWHPDVVVSLSGYNDFGYKLLGNWRPFYPPFYESQEERLKDVSVGLEGIRFLMHLAEYSSFFRKLKVRVGAGAPSAAAARERMEWTEDQTFDQRSPSIWVQNMAVLSGMLKSQGVPHLVVLQPAFFLSPIESPEEENTLKVYQDSMGPKTIQRLKKRYREGRGLAQAAAKEGRFRFLDVSSLKGEVPTQKFLDQCHLTEQGVALLMGPVADGVRPLLAGSDSP